MSMQGGTSGPPESFCSCEDSPTSQQMPQQPIRSANKQNFGRLFIVTALLIRESIKHRLSAGCDNWLDVRVLKFTSSIIQCFFFSRLRIVLDVITNVRLQILGGFCVLRKNFIQSVTLQTIIKLEALRKFIRFFKGFSSEVFRPL